MVDVAPIFRYDTSWSLLSCNDHHHGDSGVDCGRSGDVESENVKSWKLHYAGMCEYSF